MKYLQESRKSIYLASAFLGAILLAVPVVVLASPSFYYSSSAQGKSVNAFNSAPSTLFFGNSSSIPYANGTSIYNYAGTGGNDTFVIYAGNDTTQATLTGVLNNTFIINGTGSGKGSVFSMMSGANSTYRILENNQNLSSFIITGGAGSVVNETGAHVGSALYSINLGTNSSVVLSSDFEGNSTTVNVIF